MYLKTVKKAAALILAAATLAGMCACGPQSEKPLAASSPAEVYIASDLHYLSPQLTDYSAEFLALFENGDGKMTHYSPQITDALLTRVIEEKPNALILSGDLTYNGEEVSHIELAEKLADVEEAGIHVLVIPGNHDISNFFAMGFENGGAYAVKYITAERFKELYGAFGYNDAISRDENTFSYMYALRTDLYILMLDARTGVVNGELLAWVKSQLEYAESDGAEVIAVSHYNLFTHNEMFDDGYTLVNNGALSELYKRFGVRLNLSGHLHIQDIAEYSGIYDIACGALCDNPMRYGVLNLQSDGTAVYNAECADVSAYARSINSNDDNLLDFAEYAQNFFDGCSSSKAGAMLNKSGISGDEYEQMLDFAVKSNRFYFAGTLDLYADELMKSEGFGLWQQKGTELRWYNYLMSMYENLNNDIYLKIE